MDLQRILINLDDLPKIEDELLLYGRNKYQELLLTSSAVGVHLSLDFTYDSRARVWNGMLVYYRT